MSAADVVAIAARRARLLAYVGAHPDTTPARAAFALGLARSTVNGDWRACGIAPVGGWNPAATRAAILAAVADEPWSSEAEIGVVVGCSHHTVAKYLRDAIAAGEVEMQAPKDPRCNGRRVRLYAPADRVAMVAK